MADKLNFYETLYLVRPDIESGELAVIQDKLAGALGENLGETIRNEKWSERDIAYEIQGYRRGTYHILTYKAQPGVVAAMEKHLRFHKSDVMRFITVSVDEEQAHAKEPEKPPVAEKTENKPEPRAEKEKAAAEPARQAPQTEKAANETAVQSDAPETNQWKSAESPRKNEEEK